MHYRFFKSFFLYFCFIFFSFIKQNIKNFKNLTKNLFFFLTMNNQINSNPKAGLQELLSIQPSNNSFKKIKSNSINVIDFESTLSAKNKPMYTQGANLHLKRRELLKHKPETQSNETKQQKEMNNSLYKYLETNPNNNFNSTHFSNLETNSNKTKETNGASTNHETNRHSFSMIFNLKNNNNSPHHIKDQTKPINNNLNNQQNSNNMTDIKKKINSASIGNLTIDQITNSRNQFHGLLKPPMQNGKIGNRTDFIKKDLKKSADEKNRQNIMLTASLYNDFKQVFDFKLDL